MTSKCFLCCVDQTFELREESNNWCMMPKGGYNFKHRSITDYSNPAWVTDNIVVYYNRAEHWFCFFLQVMLLNQTRPHRAMKVKRWPLMEKKECNTQCKFSSKILVHWFMRVQIRVTAKLSILLHFWIFWKWVQNCPKVAQKGSKHLEGNILSPFIISWCCKVKSGFKALLC